MGKHSKDKAEDDEGTFSGDLYDGALKGQLSERAPKGDGVGDSSLSPIDTF